MPTLPTEIVAELPVTGTTPDPVIVTEPIEELRATPVTSYADSSTVLPKEPVKSWPVTGSTVL